MTNLPEIISATTSQLVAALRKLATPQERDSALASVLQHLHAEVTGTSLDFALCAESPMTPVTEYRLCKDHDSVWITVESISTLIKKTDEGVVVDLFGVDKEDQGAMASTYLFFAEAQ